MVHIFPIYLRWWRAGGTCGIIATLSLEELPYKDRLARESLAARAQYVWDSAVYRPPKEIGGLTKYLVRWSESIGVQNDISPEKGQLFEL